jgi:hypothetical protein
MEKYIMENGIILLIEKYKKSIIEEPLKLLIKNKKNLYFDEKCIFHIKHKNQSGKKRIIIHIMTKNSFVIVICKFRQFDIIINTNEIFFDEQNKEMYINELIKSMEDDILFSGSNINYNKIIAVSENDLYRILEKYNTEFYNIKFQGYSSYGYKNLYIYVKQHNTVTKLKTLIKNNCPSLVEDNPKGPILNVENHITNTFNNKDIYVNINIYNFQTTQFLKIFCNSHINNTYWSSIV